MWFAQFHRRCIADCFFAASQVAQKAADDFAGVGFGEGVGKLDVAGAGDRAQARLKPGTKRVFSV